MNIPKDKLKHFAAGAAASGACALVWFVAHKTGLVPLSPAWLCALTGAAVAGVVKEKADADDNKLVPGMHGVELLDALATAAGGIPVAALVYAIA